MAFSKRALIDRCTKTILWYIAVYSPLNEYSSALNHSVTFILKVASDKVTRLIRQLTLWKYIHERWLVITVDSTARPLGEKDFPVVSEIEPRLINYSHTETWKSLCFFVHWTKLESK